MKNQKTNCLRFTISRLKDAAPAVKGGINVISIGLVFSANCSVYPKTIMTA